MTKAPKAVKKSKTLGAGKKLEKKTTLTVFRTLTNRFSGAVK